jgi:hypothetical protein
MVFTAKSGIDAVFRSRMHSCGYSPEKVNAGSFERRLWQKR